MCNKSFFLLLLLGSLVDDSHHTSQVGTQLYMSPEQVIVLLFILLHALMLGLNLKFLVCQFAFRSYKWVFNNNCPILCADWFVFIINKNTDR